MTPQTDSLAQPIKVLLVDDHEHVLWGLGKLIDGEWPRMMVIGTARTVAQAMTTMKERNPDVIVLDIFLGEDNSVDHLERIALSGGAPVLMLTGATDEELHRRALAQGARGVVLKEAPAEVLLQEIERAHRAMARGART